MRSKVAQGDFYRYMGKIEKIVGTTIQSTGPVCNIGDVCRIYLNFSDPWPKARHHRRRLTSRCFLSKYTEVLNESKSLIFKTDNRNLFEFTLLELSARKDSLISVDLDLHSKDFEPDDERLILTEYEKRFMAQKLPIYRLEAQLLGNNRL